MVHTHLKVIPNSNVSSVAQAKREKPINNKSIPNTSVNGAVVCITRAGYAASAKNNKENASLRKRSKVIEQNITEYLESKDQPGVKFQDTAIVVDKRPKWSYKSKKDTEEDSLRILEDYGVSNAKEVLDELSKARKGNEIETKKIKIKKIKSKK